MKVSLLFVVVAFVLLQYNLAFKILKLNTTLADEELSGIDGFGKELNVEERYLTNNQIQNKLIKSWNRYAAMVDRVTAVEDEIAALKDIQETHEANITALMENQETIQHSLSVKCFKIDELLDTGVASTTQDCCQSGYYVLCLGRSSANLFTDFVKEPAGTCGACLLYTSPRPRDATLARMPSSA